MNDSLDLGLARLRNRRRLDPSRHPHLCVPPRRPRAGRDHGPLPRRGGVAIGQPGSTWEGDRLHFAANPPPDVTRRVGSRPGHSSA
jgi:hypothetical protein